jgi:hypothetical protein
MGALLLFTFLSGIQDASPMSLSISRILKELDSETARSKMSIKLPLSATSGIGKPRSRD